MQPAGGLPVRREEKRVAELLQAGAAIFAEGEFKGGNDARYRGAGRSVDQIALPAGLLKVVSLRAHCRSETIAVSAQSVVDVSVCSSFS